MFYHHTYCALLLITIFGICTTNAATYNCTSDSQCNHGRCIGFYSKDFLNETKICHCDKGYVDYNGGTCNYKQKKQLIAFLLAFFLGEFGANWFYVGDSDVEYDGIGALKCILFVLAIVFSIASFCLIADYDNGCAGLPAVISVLLWLIIIAWYMADWIRIAADPCNMKDPNGICLESW
jgi:hypothetical protein